MYVSLSEHVVVQKAVQDSMDLQWFLILNPVNNQTCLLLRLLCEEFTTLPLVSDR